MKKSKKSFVLFSMKTYTPAGKAAIVTLAFTVVYLIFEIVFKYIFYKQLCTWEIVQIFLIYAIFGLLKKAFSGNAPVCDFKGNVLPYDDTEESYRIRNKFYKKSALIYSLIFSVITFAAFNLSFSTNGMAIVADLILDKEVPAIYTASVSTVFAFVFVYVLSYMFEFIFGEHIKHVIDGEKGENNISDSSENGNTDDDGNE